MKPAPFAYARPGTVAGVCSELERDGAKVIAGGQSLLPVLAMRLGRPNTLVDINAVDNLAVLAADRDSLRVGATVRQRRLQRDPKIANVPLLALALPWVGHRETRSRGTVCGSIAHADPAAELPAVAACLEATMVLAASGRRRELSAREFFCGAMTTALKPDELLIEVRFPVIGSGEAFAFGEVARRHGDFALAGVAVRVHRIGDQNLGGRLTCFGVSDRPVSVELDPLLAFASGRDRSRLRRELKAPAQAIAAELVSAADDVHASRAYRQHLLATLIAREVSRAAAELLG